MEKSHGTDLTQFSAYSKLQAFIEKSRSEPGSFEEFEVALGAQIRALETEVKEKQLARYDIDAQTIIVAGVTMNLCLKKEKKRYLTSSGPVEVARNLFRSSGGSKAVCPLELRAGIVGGICTPTMARMVSYSMGHMTSAESAALFREFGIEGPSSSTCDRIPKVVSKAWEARRVEWEEALRAAETVPAEATVRARSGREAVPTTLGHCTRSGAAREAVPTTLGQGGHGGDSRSSPGRRVGILRGGRPA